MTASIGRIAVLELDGLAEVRVVPVAVQRFEREWCVDTSAPVTLMVNGAPACAATRSAGVCPAT